MDVVLTIGEFSKMTYLSVKALRHYHDIGLLEPAAIDPETGYRHYVVAQVPTAQAIRRFRDLDMPIDQVRAVIEAPDTSSRNQAILEHLERMQAQLERTQTTVSSLQALLAGGANASANVRNRRLPTTRCIAIVERVTFDDSASWCEAVMPELHDALARVGLRASGADSALYPDEFFELGAAEVTAFVPITGTASASGLGRSELLEVPAVDVAVLLHEGPVHDLDQAYAALGSVVAERGIGTTGPIREHYLAATTTEVCWPVSATG
jgi:DNA-binding transcriptional MerR regulator/effector-binding domain-containing protein